MILGDVQKIQPNENGDGKLDSSKILLRSFMLLILVELISSACKKLVKSHEAN